MKKTYALILQNKSIILFYSFAILVLLGVFIIPPLLIKFVSVFNTPATNFLTLILCTVVCISALYKMGWDFKKELKKNFDWKHSGIYLVFTLAGVIFLLYMKNELGLVFRKGNMTIVHYIFVIPVCLAQVISFQEYLPRRLLLFTKSKVVIVIVCVIFFTVMHIMFKTEFVFICAVGGIGFSWIYLYYPSIILMTLSHGILNIITAYMGAFGT